MGSDAYQDSGDLRVREGGMSEKREAVIAFCEANQKLIEELARVRAEMTPEPSLEVGDKLEACFADVQEGSDEFLIDVESVTPTEDIREVTITAKVRFTDEFWARMKA